MALVLHFHPLAAYGHKVLIALYEAGTPFKGQLVNLGDPDARAAFLALWPTGKLPLLRDEDRARTVPETSIIIEYLDQHYPGRLPLLPADPDARLEARLWDRLFDAYIMTPMQTLVADHMRPEGEHDPRAVEGARATLAMAYAMIDRHMGDRTWAAGDAFSLADCAAAPSLFYAGTLVPFAPSHPNLTAYFDRLVARPSVARTFAEARPYFHLYPFKEAIPRRFLEDA